MTDIASILDCYRSGQISEAEMVEICCEWPEVEAALRESTATNWIDGRLCRAFALIEEVYGQTTKGSDAHEVLKAAMDHLEDADCAMRFEQREPRP